MAAFALATRDLPGERSAVQQRRHCCAMRRTRRGTRARLGAPAGIMLYGSAPDHPERRSADWDLQPGMTLSTKLLAVQELQPGDTVGYGSASPPTAPMRPGRGRLRLRRRLPAIAAAGTPVLVDGVRTRTVGRVSMDMVAPWTTPCAAGMEVGMGSEVTLWSARANATCCPSTRWRRRQAP